MYLHCLFALYVRLKTIGVDPEPARFVQIQYKNSHPMIPFDMPLSRAISLYPDLAMNIRTQQDADMKSPPLSRQVSLGLFQLHGPGGLRAAKSQVGMLIGSCARRSEYQLHWVDPHHLCVEFEGSQSVVHKVCFSISQ